jgi:hypothetical protein
MILYTKVLHYLPRKKEIKAVPVKCVLSAVQVYGYVFMWDIVLSASAMGAHWSWNFSDRTSKPMSVKFIMGHHSWSLHSVEIFDLCILFKSTLGVPLKTPKLV